MCGSLDAALNRVLQVTNKFKNYFFCPPSARFHDSPMTQSEAKKFCEEEQKEPARLVEIDSAEENSAIIAEIKRQKTGQNIEFWLGITDRHSEGHWVLESTNKSAVFGDWASGEPDNGDGSYSNIYMASDGSMHRYDGKSLVDPPGDNCAHLAAKWGYKWNDIDCNYKGHKNGTSSKLPHLHGTRTALCEIQRKI